MKRLYLIIGETGAGKDTVVDAVCKKTGFKKVVSYSDAPIRPDQKDGIDHIFVTPEEFDRIMATCQTIAYTQIGINRYMATMEQIDNATRFYIIDPAGVEEMEKLYGDVIDFFKIYIHVPEEIRRQRTAGRGSYNFEKRMNAEREQFYLFDHAGKWDLRIENIDLEKTIAAVESAVNNIERAFAAHEAEIRKIRYVQRYRKLCNKYWETMKSTQQEDSFVITCERMRAAMKEAAYALMIFCGCSEKDTRDMCDQEYRNVFHERRR